MSLPNRWIRVLALPLWLAGSAALAAAPAGAVPADPVAAAAAPGTQAAEPLAPARITSSFEVRYAGPLLRRLARLFQAGFGRRDAEALLRQIDALPADQPRTWKYEVTYKGVRYPLRVRALLDDLGMLDLDFFTADALAPRIRAAVDDYLNARGL